MSAIPFCEDVLDESEPVLSLPDVAKQLGLPVTRVHQLLRDRHIVAVKRGGIIAVPEAFFTRDGKVLKPLPGLLIVLKDGGYSEAESLRWMFTDDDSLPGKPIAALRGHLAREVLRRAQAMAF